MLDIPTPPLFRSGDNAFYPGSGVVTIIGIEEIRAGSFATDGYKMAPADGRSIVRVPIDKAAKNGLRKIGTAEEVQRVIAILKGNPHGVHQKWITRAKECRQKLQSGDLCVIAEVLRDLHKYGEENEKAYFARELCQHALKLLIPELALIMKMLESETLAYLKKETGKAFRPGSSSGAQVILLRMPQKGSAPRASASRPAALAKPPAPSMNHPDIVPPQPKPTPTRPAPVRKTQAATPAVTREPDAARGPAAADQEEMRELRATVRKLGENLAKLRAEYSGLRAQLTQKDAKLGASTARAADLEEQLRSVRAELHEAYAAQERMVQTHEATLAALVEKANAADKPSRKPDPGSEYQEGSDGTLWKASWKLRRRRRKS